MLKAAMVKLLAFLLLILPLQAEEFYARITFYTGTKNALGGRLVRGRSCAAEKKFKFGTEFNIPALNGVVGSGRFVKDDVGAAVEKRTASGGRLPVIDIYVGSRAEVKRLAATKKFHKVLVKTNV